MAKKTKEQLKAELNGWGRAYNAAKRRGHKEAMAEAHAKANAIRKEAGWDYDEKTGVTTQKSSSGKSTTITSATNIENAKVKDPKKLKTFAEEKKAVAQKQAAKSLPALGGLMDKSTQAAVNNLTAGSTKDINRTLALGNGPVKNALPVAQSTQKSSGGKWTADNIAKGFGYGAERTLSGTVGAVEDTLRFVSGYGNKLLSGITSLGGLADNPVSDFLAKTAEDTLANSLTDRWKQDIQDRYQPDKTAQFIGSLGEAAGAMLPTIAAGLATGGMSAGTAIGKGAAMTAQAAQAAGKVSSGAGLVTMLPSVMGSSTRQAINEGADIDKALTYGALSGALEVGTESLFAGIPGMKSGTVSDIIKRITQNPVAERALDIAGEGAEEVISGAVSPILQRLTYNENAENASANELLAQFLSGALLSGAMQGASGVAARVADVGLMQHGRKNSAPDGTPFAASDVLPKQTGQKEKTPYMRPNPGLQLPSAVADGVFDERIPQVESEINTKNNKSIDQLLSSRLQLPNAMADDTLVAYSIAQAGAKNNQTGDVLRRVVGIENPPETAAEIRAAEQSAQAGMQQSMEYMDTWNAEADRNTAQSTIPQAEMQADTQDTTGQESPGRVKAAAKDLYRNFISGQAELEAVAKAQKKINPNRANAEDLVQMSRTADATVDMIAAGHMVDRTGNRMGDSWNDLVGALTPEQSELLNLYRQHKHNIDRMSLKEKAAPGLETVRNELAALRAQHPSMATLTESQLQEIARTEHGYLQVTALEFLDVIERERQLAAVTDKPVLGRREEGKSQTIPYTAEESRKIVQELEQAHPELKKQAEAIQRFHDDFMQEWAVGSGLMSQAQWQVLKDKYPDYVQTFRARDEWGNADITRRGRIDSMSPIRQAVGDISEIIPFEDAEMMQVNAIVKAARRNELFRNLYDFAKEHPKQAAPFIRIKAQNSATPETMAGEYDSTIENVTQNAMRTENGSYQIIAMIDGKPVQMEVNAEIYAGLQNLYGQDRGASDAFGAKVAKGWTNLFKQLTTGRNPLFFLSNFPKDFQTAYINTTSGRKTLAGYLWDVGGTVRSMAQNSSEWQTFQALGGKNSGFYHNEKGFRESAKTAEHRGVRRAVDMISTPFEMVSENTEALWRFNEYRAAIRKYGDTQEGRAKAMQAAADVTTNFSRSAPMAKATENYCAYLNASLQGLDKMARQLKNHPFLTTRRAAEIIALPTILLYMLNKDDEDYQHLNDRTKDNYYCIPTGKGTFIKIPKSREYGVAMGALLERFMRLRDGEDPETALDGIGGQFLTNIAPSNPFTDNIAKTIFIDLPTNRDFAGRSIIPERLANLSPENQYDYTTSKAGIAASKAWNATLGRLFPKMAPIQADYLIDSNLGFVGDMILGSTQQGSKSVGDVLKAVIAEPVVRKLTADPLYQNGVTDAFYKELSKAEIAANDKNLTEGLESRVITPEEKYLSALQASSSEISELRKREREILSDTTISKQEQEAQAREIRREINRIALGAKAQAEQERDAWAKNYVPEISHLTDKKQKEARAAYEQNGTPYTDFVRYDDRYRLLQKDKETSSAADRAKLAGYLEGDDTLTDAQKEGLYEHLLIPYLSDSRKEDWDKTYKSKVAPSLFFEIANEYSQIGDELDDLEKGKAQAKATAFSMYLDGMGLSDDVRSQVENDFKYFNMNPAKSENYTFEMMRKNGGKNEQAYADALKQSGLSIETYYEIKDMKNAKDADGSYTYKKDDIVQEMRDKGFTTAQIGAVCGAFGWKAPSSGSGKSSSGSKKTSSGSSTENTLRRLAGLPKLPKLGK